MCHLLFYVKFENFSLLVTTPFVGELPHNRTMYDPQGRNSDCCFFYHVNTYRQSAPRLLRPRPTEQSLSFIILDYSNVLGLT